MARILIRRADGRIQRYHVKKSHAMQMISVIESVKYHGIKRNRRIYASPSVMPLKKERVYPQIINKKEYEKSITMTTDRPIHGEPGQVHVRLRATKDGKSQEADGYSHVLDLERQYKRGIYQASEAALYEMGYAVDTDLYRESGIGRPDSVKPLKIDFITVVKK